MTPNPLVALLQGLIECQPASKQKSLLVQMKDSVPLLEAISAPSRPGRPADMLRVIIDKSRLYICNDRERLARWLDLSPASLTQYLSRNDGIYVRGNVAHEGYYRLVEVRRATAQEVADMVEAHTPILSIADDDMPVKVKAGKPKPTTEHVEFEFGRPVRAKDRFRRKD